MIGVVELEVGDQPQLGMEADQGSVGFVGFSHQPFTGPIAGIAAEGGHDSTNDRRGIQSSAVEQAGDQAAGGCFAMTASHRDAALRIDQPGQQF